MFSNRMIVAVALSLLGSLMTSCESSEGSDGDGGSAQDATIERPDAPITAPEMSGGCGQAGSATGVSNHEVTIGDQTRAYVLAVPDAYDPNTAYPLVFAWHGRGGSAAGARAYFGVEQAAAGAAILVYPQGLPLESQGGQTGWQLGPNSPDLELFDSLVDSIGVSHCIDEARIFSTGHSFGGYMSNSLGCYRAETLRGIAPVAGGGPYGGCDTQGVAAWLAHGENDQVVSFSEGQSAHAHWQAANGCDLATDPAAPDPCVTHQGCDALPVTWCVHQNTSSRGHGWPAFAADGIWGFFDQLK